MRIMRIAGMVVAAAVVMGSLTPLPPPLGAQPATSASDLCDAEDVATFADVNPGDYGAAYILCMKALGLSLGKGDGSYGVGDNLTRAQMASFVVRLWRDILGRQCPDDTVSPFTDVDPAGTHTSNIDCIYGLGITKGTTTTTYSPVAPLTASQISRFLLRMYKKVGNTCPEAAAELDEALACLEELRVVPTKAEGSSSDAVTRDQMAVYLIGLWHNLSGRGLPPQPPTKAAFDTTTTTTVAEEETTGADDRAALVALYNATDGANWENNDNWLSDRPLGQWLGVTTDNNGRVTQLNLQGDGLTGPIPSQLGNLSNLEVLVLGGSELTGPIPSWIGNLSNLQHLNLNHGELTGPIPSQLGNLSNLQYLGLGRNGLTGPIPSQLGNLSNLQTLYLGGNPSLSGALPRSFTGLTSLLWLGLERTQLCAPADSAFQSWLRGVEKRRGVVNCAAATASDDRAALMALYNATDGANWENNDNWLSDRPLGQWLGVTTDNNGRVTQNSIASLLPSGWASETTTVAAASR